VVCPWGKTDCLLEASNGNQDKERQCWLYYIDECDETASLYTVVPTLEKIILVQCDKCGSWHDDAVGDDGQLWAPFCDLFHGNGLAYPCSEFKPRSDEP